MDKDKMRCHYCNEFGHFIRECSKRSRDEEEARHFSGLNSDYYENDGTMMCMMKIMMMRCLLL